MTNFLVLRYVVSFKKNSVIFRFSFYDIEIFPFPYRFFLLLRERKRERESDKRNRSCTIKNFNFHVQFRECIFKNNSIKLAVYSIFLRLGLHRR